MLVSQGIGSTPMTGMLAALVADGSGRAVTVIHGDAAAASYAQREVTDLHVKALAERGEAKHVVRYRDAGDTVDLAALLEASDVQPGARWYLCGGNTFLQDVRGQLAEHAARLRPAGVHYELFSPNDWLI